MSILGFEPKTICLKGNCSTRWSYILVRSTGLEPVIDSLEDYCFIQS